MKLCISTIPARTENSQRLAGSEDKVEQIHTLCHPKNSSITQSSLWKCPYGKFGFNKVMPIWKNWHSHPQSCVRLQVHSRSHLASSPPGPETIPVPVFLALDLPMHVLCCSPSQAVWAARICRTKEALGATPCYWWEEESSMFLQRCRYANHFRQELRHLSTASQCHIQGFYFLLFSSLGPGSAKVQPAAAPFFDYWWGFIFYIQLCRCARHFTQIHKDRALKSLYSSNMSQHS